MKKIWMFILLISISGQLMGQNDNQLNKMIIESLRSCMSYNSELQKKCV